MFASPAASQPKPDALEIATDRAIAACDGDPRAAVQALIIAVGLLESELNEAGTASSKGHARKMKQARSG
jgi:hypothetical protein